MLSPRRARAVCCPPGASARCARRDDRRRSGTPSAPSLRSLGSAPPVFLRWPHDHRPRISCRARTCATSQTVVAAPGAGPGYWAGGPSAVEADGVIHLAYRLRRPVGVGRGYANVVASSRDGVHFETVCVLERDAFGAESLERPALVRRPDGGWRIYISSATPGSLHWWVDAIDADDPPAFDPERRATVWAGDASTAVKDPVVKVRRRNLARVAVRARDRRSGIGRSDAYGVLHERRRPHLGLAWRRARRAPRCVGRTRRAGRATVLWRRRRGGRVLRRPRHRRAELGRASPARVRSRPGALHGRRRRARARVTRDRHWPALRHHGRAGRRRAGASTTRSRAPTAPTTCARSTRPRPDRRASRCSRHR